MSARVSATLLQVGRTSLVRPVSRSLLTLTQARQQHQQARSQSRSSSSSYGRLFGAIAAAVLTGGVTIVACEKVVEQKKGGNVNYDALRKDLEELIESAEGERHKRIDTRGTEDGNGNQNIQT